MPSTVNLLDLDLPGLEALVGSLGGKPFHARQLMQWVYKRGVTEFERMTDLSKSLRAKLACVVETIVPAVVEERRSDDGTRKLLLGLADGERIETVLIPDEDRLTQCISSQAGCAMGCAFCRTGKDGLRRNLSVAEIVGQVLVAQTCLEPGQRITNVVFMGMGEPLHNLDAVVRAFGVLSDDHGPNIAKRRLTVSTCGLVDAMRRLPSDVVGSLAVSLNATTDEVRSRLMPVNRRYPLSALISTLRDLPLAARARYTIEYVLLGGINDSLDDARRLVRLLAELRCKVNLIEYNPHAESPFEAPAPAAVESFQGYLLEKHFTAFVRRSRGRDISAACGQLWAGAGARTA